MDFTFSDDQQAINLAAREMLIETATPESYRKMIDAGEARNEARWQIIAEMGLIGMLAPEDKGGLGLGMVDLIAIAEAAGYVALPEPLIEQAGIVVPLLARLDNDHGWLKRVLGGATIAVGHPTHRFVADADSADALLLADGQKLHIVDRGNVTLTRQESLDPLRRLFTVDWTVSDATAIDLDWGDTFERGALLAAAQLIGLGQRCIDMSVAYTSDREQFGKPIGTFQAVKHMLAQPQVKIEFARPVVHAGAAELTLGTQASRARIAHAKFAAGEAADLAAHNAVQAHGAMGITWEIDLHFMFKRVLALRYAWGASGQHLGSVVERMTSLPVGPETTFASEHARTA